jgi:hypothetical protein
MLQQTVCLLKLKEALHKAHDSAPGPDQVQYQFHKRLSEVLNSPKVNPNEPAHSCTFYPEFETFSESQSDMIFPLRI